MLALSRNSLLYIYFEILKTIISPNLAKCPAHLATYLLPFKLAEWSIHSADKWKLGTNICMFARTNDDPFRTSAFGLRFTSQRGENVTHFIILHHFVGPHCRISRKRSQGWVYVSAVLWFDAGLKNVSWGMVKEKSCIDICLLLSKALRGRPI